MHPLISKQPAAEVGKMVAIKTKKLDIYQDGFYVTPVWVTLSISLILGFDLSFDRVFTVKISIYKYVLYSFQV